MNYQYVWHKNSLFLTRFLTIISFLILLFTSPLSANPAFWNDIQTIDLTFKKTADNTLEDLFATSGLDKYRLLELSENDLVSLLETSGNISHLEQAEARSSHAVEQELAVEISLPRLEGGFIKVMIVKEDLLSPEIAIKHPDILIVPKVFTCSPHPSTPLRELIYCLFVA